RSCNCPCLYSRSCLRSGPPLPLLPCRRRPLREPSSWRAHQRSPRPSSCRSSSCEPPVGTTPFARDTTGLRAATAVAFVRHAAGCRASSNTSKRVIVFQDERLLQRAASARGLTSGGAPAGERLPGRTLQRSDAASSFVPCAANERLTSSERIHSSHSSL